MTTEIAYKDKGREYLGRNGYGKQYGMIGWISTSCLVLEPINSKGDPARCKLEIPSDEIDSVIGLLETLKKEVEIQKREYENGNTRRIIDIINRKGYGEECTEDDHAKLKNWLRELRQVGEQHLEQAIADQFPKEYGEWLDENKATWQI